MSVDPLTWLFGLEQLGMKFGLDNIETVVEALGHPERSFASVHVAGTNGKGSVTAMVDTALRSAGHRTARYTSPHLIDLTERFVIDGRPIAAHLLASAITDVRLIVEGLRDKGRLQVHPTYFEVTTAVAFELFRRAGVAIAVCEVGLGGRLDATNVLRPVVAAVTSVGLDHEQYLGRTLREIAAEKAGIVKPAVPLIVGSMHADALAAIEEIARQRRAELVRAWEGVAVERVEQLPRGGATAWLRTPRHDYGQIEVALRGAHQIDNAVVAVRLLETLNDRGFTVPPDSVAEGLARVQWPGRLDLRRLPDGREVLLDAAHNPDGAAALAAYLGKAGSSRAPLVFAAMRDKDASSMLRTLAPVVSTFIFTRASNARSTDPAALAALARTHAPGVPVVVQASPDDALADAWRVSPRIVVAGSIFLVGDVMKAIARS